MTDHLEPFRRMIRSMRFVPPLGRSHLTHEQVTLQPPTNSWASSIKANEVRPAPVSPLNHYEHVAALVREAVAKPTVLPVSYTILDNIGDRISRLAPAKTVTPLISPPKIPQPDPNWKPTPSIELKHTKFEKELVSASYEETSVSEAIATELPSKPSTAEENLVDVVTVDDVLKQEEIALPTSVSEAIVQRSEPANRLDPEALDRNLPDVQNDLAATVEPTESLLETADKEEKLQIQCPKCESSKIWKSGHYKGKQRYACKDCGKKFILPESVAENTDSQTNANSISNQSEVKALQANGDIAGNSQKVSKSRQKGKAKGFGSRKK